MSSCSAMFLLLFLHVWGQNKSYRHDWDRPVHQAIYSSLSMPRRIEIMDHVGAIIFSPFPVINGFPAKRKITCFGEH